jgi:hypothetical protein
MAPLKSKSRPTPADVLAAKPLRLFAAAPIETSSGQWRLTVPLKHASWATRLLRVPSNATKTFELDDLGKLVWDACDGKTDVRQIIRTLASRYDLNQREAEVATLAFLRTLMRKGLVGIPVKEAK